MNIGFRWMYFVSAEAGVGIDYQDLTRQDVEEEPTGTYLWRVLVSEYPAPAPLPSRDAVIGPLHIKSGYSSNTTANASIK